jgi:hypothetical protein
MRIKHRLEQLESQDRASGAGSIFVVIWRAGQSKEQACAAYEVEHGPIDPKGLCVIIRKFCSGEDLPCAA